MTPRRSIARTEIARAIWYVKPGVVEIRASPLPPPQPTEARVRTLYTGISRGTERLVLAGAVGKSEWNRMRAPLQDGDFPFPVKYGYCATGTVEIGPPELRGRAVFCLHPHQDVFNAPFTMLVPLPDGLPPRRATLAANMETALNALWDGGAGPGDRIVIVGAGVVGLCVAAIAARLPGADVTVVDVAADRAGIVAALGARFCTPAEVPGDADVVVHTSVTAAGLNTAIRAAGFEATVVELSWYGDKPVAAELGDAFHSRRLRLISSQVGRIAQSKRERWSFRRRLETALELLQSAALDALVADAIAFDDAATALPALLAPGAPGLAPVIRYGS